MKILFNCCVLDYYFDGCNVKFGIGWYRHSKKHKWWGLTVEFYLFKWIVIATYVSNRQEYDKKINYRRHKK